VGRTYAQSFIADWFRKGNDMSVNSRGCIIAANLLLAVITQSARADATLTSPAANGPVSQHNGWMNESSHPSHAPLVIDSLWKPDSQHFSFSPDAAPVAAPSSSDEKPPAVVKDDLIVPFPALGAGWILLMGGAMYRMGKRIIRPI
jgi:hypothetical protein